MANLTPLKHSRGRFSKSHNLSNSSLIIEGIRFISTAPFFSAHADHSSASLRNGFTDAPKSRFACRAAASATNSLGTYGSVRFASSDPSLAMTPSRAKNHSFAYAPVFAGNFKMRSGIRRSPFSFLFFGNAEASQIDPEPPALAQFRRNKASANARADAGHRTVHVHDSSRQKLNGAMESTK